MTTQECCKIIIELDEFEAVLLFGMVSERTRGLPTGIPSRQIWYRIWNRLADSLLHVYRS